MKATHEPKDFFTDTPPDRIIGTETECDLQLLPGDSCEIAQLYVSADALNQSPYEHHSSYLNNGMRAYYDVRHLEICSAEARGPRQAAAAHAASLIALTNIVTAYGREHRGLYLHAGTAIRDLSESSGYHENYLMPRTLTHTGYLETIMGSLLASRIYCLSGVVGPHGFKMSQKAHAHRNPAVIFTLERRTSQNNKPMACVPSGVNDRDTMGNTDWARLEVRNAETGFSNTAKFLGYAVTSLGLRVIEQADRINKKDLKRLGGATFDDIAGAAKMFGNDRTFRQRARTIDGKDISALDYNLLFADVVSNLAEKVELPQDELDGLDLLYKVCGQMSNADLGSGEYGDLLTTLEFAPRHKYLSTRFGERQLHSRNNRAVAANLLWDRMLPEGGGMKFWNRIGSPYVSDKEIDDLVYNPPETRAAARAAFINTHGKQIWKLNWVDGMTVTRQAATFQDPWNPKLHYR